MIASTFITGWNRFFFRKGPPHVLALFRFAFGGFLLFHWGIKLPSVPMLFSEEGILLPLFDLPLLTPPSVSVAWLLFFIFLGSLLLLTIGFFSRIAAGTAFLFSSYYYLLSFHLFGTSFDHLFLFILLVLTFSPSDRTLSLRMFLKRRSFFAAEPITIFPQRLLALQITFTYLGVGWQKLFLPDWQSGRILLLGFMGRWATLLGFAVARLDLPPWFYDAIVFLTKGFEILIPFGLWIKRFGIRWWFFAGGVLFHISIALLLGIWWFLVLIPAYILFFEPEEVEKWFERYVVYRMLYPKKDTPYHIRHTC